MSYRFDFIGLCCYYAKQTFHDDKVLYTMFKMRKNLSCFRYVYLCHKNFGTRTLLLQVQVMHTFYHCQHTLAVFV
jgi:hypothetical protein